jgi:hypothetical protein
MSGRESAAGSCTTWRDDPRSCVARLLAVDAVFGELRNDEVVRAAVTRELQRIAGGGVRAALRAAV